jgi:large subunit ribosomal protein L5
MSNATVTATKQAPRLKQRYDAEIRDALKAQLNLSNVMEVPKLTKIVINMGVGRATQQPSLLEGAVNDLTKIVGQKPLVTKARQSVDRRQGHLARRPDVGVPRPPDRRCDPAHP